jgi:hypothetical protein
MPNGKPGDHPYTDIVVHGRRVYSEAVDELVRHIAPLASQSERDQLAEVLLNDYDDFNNPDSAKLELYGRSNGKALRPNGVTSLNKNAHRHQTEEVLRAPYSVPC